MIAMMLASFLVIADADTDQERCMREFKCPHDGEYLGDLQKSLSKEEYTKIVTCRVDKILKCLVPEKDE